MPKKNKNNANPITNPNKVPITKCTTIINPSHKTKLKG
jgi:hypothetical protein